MSLFKVNKDNLTVEEKKELIKNCKVIHSDENSIIVETNKEANKSKDIDIIEIHEINE